MKKIFTMISAMLLAGGFAINAEKVTFSVGHWGDGDSYVYDKDFESDFIKNADGSYTIKEFLNSGNPASFKFEMPEVAASSFLKMTGNLDTSASMPYLLNADGSYMSCYVYNEDGSEKSEVEYPYVDDLGTDYSSYVYRYDMTDPENTYEYYAMIVVAGFLESGDYTPWYYVEFNFNEPETGGEMEVIGSTPIDIAVDFWDEDAYDYVQAAKNVSTELEFNSDGSYTIKDFCNSGVPVTFTNGEYTTDPDYGTYAVVSYSNLSNGYLLNPATNAMDVVCKMFAADGGDDDFTKLTDIYMGYSYLYKFEKSDPYYVADYYASLSFCGKLEDGNWSDYYYLGFYFNAPDTSGVSETEVDENAPVEYFNLQGVKVANPEKGIFIRRQGKEVKKIMVR